MGDEKELSSRGYLALGIGYSLQSCEGRLLLRLFTHGLQASSEFENRETKRVVREQREKPWSFADHSRGVTFADSCGSPCSWSATLLLIFWIVKCFCLNLWICRLQSMLVSSVTIFLVFYFIYVVRVFLCFSLRRIFYGFLLSQDYFVSCKRMTPIRLRYRRSQT